MAHDYNFVIIITSLILVACAGAAIVGFFQILKVLGFFIPWETGNCGKTTCLDKNKALEIEMILSNLPKITSTACMPGKNGRNQGLLNARSKNWTRISKEKTEIQAVAQKYK